MKDYKQLAWKYLISNKKRMMITVLGVALSVMILFAFMNSALSIYVTERNAVRKEVKYEAFFFCPSEEVAEKIAGEKCVSEWELTELTDEDGGQRKRYLVGVNFTQPFLMKGFVKEIKDRYCVEEKLSPLADYYFAEDDGGIKVVVLFGLLVAYIFAIFGVAVVRNSIQLITLEQIKDYGMLRCMGATRKQLKGIVFLMGFCLEGMGIVLGVFLGFLVYLPIAIRAELEIGFHVLGIFLLLLAFLFDLYFVMEENCKFVNKLTPVAAVRGEFQIKTTKIKAHKKSLAGYLWGIEGDYASKNLKRNPGRMWKSVGAMSMGIVMVIVAISLGRGIYEYMTIDSEQFGKYQYADVAPMKPGWGQLRYEGGLLSSENKEILINNKQVKEYKNVYEANLFAAETFEVYNHYTREFLDESEAGNVMRDIKEIYDTGDPKKKMFYSSVIGGQSLVGYDEADYENLKSGLVAGTLDVSENGIVLVNQTCAMKYTEDTMNSSWGVFQITDYRVGDTITFLDYQKLDAHLKERTKNLELRTAEGEVDYALVVEVLSSCMEEMLKNGETRTYIIEGIVGKDENRAIISGDLRFVLPLERYFEETGLTAEASSGIMCHLTGYRMDKGLEPVYKEVNEKGDFYYERYYLETLNFMEGFWELLVGVTIFILFVVIVNMLNVVNIIASDLYLRRKEFAQLRVLGMSKKKLTFTVLLEGIITSGLSGVIGVSMGYLIVMNIMRYVNKGFYVPFQFSWGLCILLVIVSGMIMCATVYLPIKGMDINMAKELQGSGE